MPPSQDTDKQSKTQVPKNWRTLYDLIWEIYELQPWSFLEETDIFGIHSPLSDTQYFISVMGSAGTLRAVSAYIGTKALSQFWALEDSGNPDSGEILTIPHMILSFGTEEEVDADQLKLLRSIQKDFGYTDEFPEVKYIPSCQFHRDPDEAELEDFIIILEQTLEVCRRAKSDPGLILSDNKDIDEYLVRENSRTKSGTAWTDKFRTIKLSSPAPKVKLKRKDIDEIISLPASQAVMQSHFQLLPLQVRGEGDIIYFPVTVIMTNKKTGRIEDNYLLTPEPDYESTLAKIPHIVMEFIKALGFRPRCIEVKNKIFFEMLYEPLRLTAIKLVLKESLPSVEEAINHFIESATKDTKEILND